jgi:hypothetical protein
MARSMALSVLLLIALVAGVHPCLPILHVISTAAKFQAVT